MLAVVKKKWEELVMGTIMGIDVIIPILVLVLVGTYGFILRYMIGRVSRKKEEEISSLKTSLSVLGKEVVSFGKSLEQVRNEKDQAHQVIRKMKGELQVLLNFFHGALLTNEFATKLKNTTGFHGEEGFEAFCQMCQLNLNMKIMFSRKQDGKGSSCEKEWFELNERGQRHFADPTYRLHVYFIVLGLVLSVGGNTSELA